MKGKVECRELDPWLGIWGLFCGSSRLHHTSWDLMTSPLGLSQLFPPYLGGRERPALGAWPHVLKGVRWSFPRCQGGFQLGQGGKTGHTGQSEPGQIPETSLLHEVGGSERGRRVLMQTGSLCSLPREPTFLIIRPRQLSVWGGETVGSGAWEEGRERDQSRAEALFWV